MTLKQATLLISLTTSREVTSAFHLFDKVKKRFGASQSIVFDRLTSYNIPTKIVFSESKHIKVQSWYDEITNNLIESFFKRFKHKYRTTHSLKFETSVNAASFSSTTTLCRIKV